MGNVTKLREKFADIHEGFDAFLADHKEGAEAAIAAVEAGYKALDGHEKLEMAIAILLEQIHIPGPFAVMASQQIVDRTEAFIQCVFNEKKAAGLI